MTVSESEFDERPGGQQGGRQSPLASIPARSWWVRYLAVLVLAWAVDLPGFVSRLLQSNFGFPAIPLLPWVFLALPAFGILLNATLSGSLRAPYWPYFLVVETIVCVREVSLFVSDGTPNFRYAWGWALFYAAFLSFVNSGVDPDTFTFFWRTAVGISGFMVAVVFLGYVGVFDLDFVPLDLATTLRRAWEGRVAARRIAHPNGLSFVLAVATLGIVSSKLDSFSGPRHWLRRNGNWLLVACFGLVVALQGSRGNLVLLAFLILIYGSFRIRRLPHRDPLGALGLLLLGSALVLTAYMATGTIVVEDVHVVEHLFSETALVARGGQVRAALLKFAENPVFGNGFYEAARGTVAGIERSNNHFAQFLSAYGVVGFLPYVLFLSQVFVRSVRRGPLLMHAVAALVALSLYNWSISMPLSLVAYSAYSLRRFSDPPAPRVRASGKVA